MEENIKLEDSILLSTKKSLGIEPCMTQFDPDIIMCINSSFDILTQLGVGPVEGFLVESEKDTWDDFFGKDIKLNMAKSYIFLKTKLLFDPPTGNAILECYKEQIREFECRMNYQVDPKYTFEERGEE